MKKKGVLKEFLHYVILAVVLWFVKEPLIAFYDSIGLPILVFPVFLGILIIIDMALHTYLLGEK